MIFAIFFETNLGLTFNIPLSLIKTWKRTLVYTIFGPCLHAHLGWFMKKRACSSAFFNEFLNQQGN